MKKIREIGEMNADKPALLVGITRKNVVGLRSGTYNGLLDLKNTYNDILSKSGMTIDIIEVDSLEEANNLMSNAKQLEEKFSYLLSK